MLKRRFAVVIFLFRIILCAAAFGEEQVNSLTYAVFPYVSDIGYYQEIIENRWAELEPDIRLERAEWDCYSDGMPEGIDVIMYDAVMRDTLIDAGWIQPIRPQDVRDSEDIYPFALEGLTRNGMLYGIPVLLCGNFLIYDRDCEVLAAAEHITDLGGASEILVINLEDPINRPQYEIEIIADIRGEANPSVDSGAEEIMRLMDRLAVGAHKKDDNTQIALAYDSGVGQGFIGFSESLRFLKNRISGTGIKSISFSEQENVPRVYADAVAVTAGVKGTRYEKCVELMNVMAEADVMMALSVQEGVPQYFLLARSSPYQLLADPFPFYSQLEKLANQENNHVILTQ